MGAEDRLPRYVGVTEVIIKEMIFCPSYKVSSLPRFKRIFTKKFQILFFCEVVEVMLDVVGVHDVSPSLARLPSCRQLVALIQRGKRNQLN